MNKDMTKFLEKIYAVSPELWAWANCRAEEGRNVSWIQSEFQRLVNLSGRT